MTKPSNFVWFDHMSKDHKGAEAFYKAVVGWSMADAGMGGDRAYTILSAGPTMVGGIMPTPPDAHDMPACWTGYIGVQDVDAKTREVVAAGGKVWREPSDIPNIGRFSVVSDPLGAGFILFKGSSDQEPAPVEGMPTGHFNWFELLTSNVDEAWGFYSKLFGWVKVDAMDMGPMGVYQIFTTRGDGAQGGMMRKPEQMPVSAWTYYIGVDTINGAVERVKSLGGSIINGPMEVPGGAWIANGFDPQGAYFSMISMKSA